MLIRTKLILNFTLLAAGILIAISIAIFIFYSLGKEKLFYSRLRQKAVSTARVFASINEMNEIALHSLDQQREAVYNKSNTLIYSSGNPEDFHPSESFLNSIRQNKEKHFAYTNNQSEEKGGVGIYYTSGKEDIIVIVTGLDKFGIERINNLRNALVICDIIGLMIVIFSAFIFSRQALKPVKEIVKQVQAIKGTKLNTRLDESNQKDEIASLAMEFNKLLDRVEKTVDSQTSFVSHASHELRTPLANILGALETSYSYDKDLNTIKQNIHTSINELKKIIQLTNGLLSLAKIENDQSKLTSERINLLELLLDSTTQIKDKYPQQSIELFVEKINHEEDEYFITGRNNLLLVAISNILDNACKYSDNSKILVSMKSENNSDIMLSISDNGLGIDKEDLQHIFDTLYRGSNVKNIPGFGIGLALVQRIVQYHHGEITITSEINKGTTVTIIFPTNQ